MSLYAYHHNVSSRLNNIYTAGFSSSTQPTIEQVAGWLDEAEDLINSTLKAIGLPAPYTDVQAKRILGKYVTDYAEGRVRRVLAATGGDGKNQDGIDLLKDFEKFLLDLQARQAFWAAILAESAVTGTTAVSAPGVGVNAAIEPWFTRDTKF